VKTVLVIGGAGYIGSHCARDLREAGWTVRVFDDLSTGHREAVTDELFEGDIRDNSALRKAVRGVDAVMHFAARALVGESTRHPSLYFQVNVGGTANIVQAMVSEGVRDLVFSSSCSVYGTPASAPVSEDFPKAPESPYGLSKLMAEQVLDLAREREGLHVACLRYFNASGAHPDGTLGESHDPETHLVPLALDAVMGKRPPLKLFGRDYPTPDGTCIRDYVHVCDLASAHRAALDRLAAGNPGRAWNLGTGRGTSVLEVLQAVERVTGRAVPVEDASRRDGDPAQVWASADRAMSDLSWTPNYTRIDDIVETAWRWATSPRY
jgi:UDP-glucose-4-epimerase GalE